MIVAVRFGFFWSGFGEVEAGFLEFFGSGDYFVFGFGEVGVVEAEARGLGVTAAAELFGDA